MGCFNIFINQYGSKKRVILGILCIWMYRRLMNFATFKGWRQLPSNDVRRKIYTILQSIDFIFKILRITNYIEFLIYGCYPSLLYRLAGYKLSSVSKLDGIKSSQIFLRSREVMLEILVGFLTALGCVADWSHIITSFNSYIKHHIVDKFKSFGIVNAIISKQSLSGNDLNSFEKLKCCLCNLNPAENPHILSTCRHVFCYYCIMLVTKGKKLNNNVSNIETKDNLFSCSCLKCGELNTSFTRWIPYNI
jgi:hypothetical protein